jgi:hypothetical protein
MRKVGEEEPQLMQSAGAVTAGMEEPDELTEEVSAIARGTCGVPGNVSSKEPLFAITGEHFRRNGPFQNGRTMRSFLHVALKS